MRLDLGVMKSVGEFRGEAVNKTVGTDRKITESTLSNKLSSFLFISAANCSLSCNRCGCSCCQWMEEIILYKFLRTENKVLLLQCSGSWWTGVG